MGRGVLLGPRILIFVSIVDQVLCIDITSKVVADQVPIDLECTDQIGKNIRFSEGSLLDLVTDLSS